MSLENPCTFLLAKGKTWKRIFNTNSELSQNRTEKHIIPPETTINWLFHDIWYYLFISFFDWKVAVFQQIVVRVYYILKITDASVKRTDPLANYRSNCNFNLKFCNRLSVLKTTLAVNRQKWIFWSFVFTYTCYIPWPSLLMILTLVS